MSSKELKVCNLFRILIWVHLVWGLAQCQQLPPGGPYDPSALSVLTNLLSSRLANMTGAFNQVINNQSSFCIKDPQADWNQAFNFSSDVTFMASCVQKTNGDVQQRLCTAAEMKFYFNNFLSGSYLKPNKNCNLSSWVSGCEPGWACSVGENEEVDFQNARDIPSRTLNCQTCCEGFFCPHGLTCMIPCPLGSYCPLATFNEGNGYCEPYSYQLPPESPNHTCGGANIWADVRGGRELFCSGGSYCPTTTQKQHCGSGHYCRLGSTSESPCFKLSSCDPNTASQNIHYYGLMLIAALVTLLLIIYNCSDQVLTTRERRLAKSRDAAAASAREAAKARQRWKGAKDAAKKHASVLQAQLSHTFSRTKDVVDSEELETFKQAEDDIHPDIYPSSSGASLPSEGKSNKPNEIENEPEGLNHGSGHQIEGEPVHLEDLKHGAEDKNAKRKIPKAKHAHTRSKIFKYAYSQLEKEKALQIEEKNLTFSGVISKATNTEVRKRPLIEIYFKDLTLTLKAKKKYLLRCITGKINPGRITAVMGPSGAGKTTFLSALAGKAIGCTVDGLILINGQNRSIHAYKRIIGFVPQDDIVHGNLTVEENLWFSANCRLSASLPKADKVLIVERVIDALGLQTVRDSLVGTVEKRGISGGQRKRVNVGLEMVMEPSLLILDEPTSGLDSSSSQLLLKALRREALGGVNICMVVHQPSYALFKMFDDLVLLAKGGFTVYHGPVNRVEQYFADLGINIPDRINPPDHFIDILEGLVKPSGGVDYKELPVRWMLHNGYPVPSDMQQSAAGIASSPVHGTNFASDGTKEKSFAGELWQDVKSNAARHRDKIRLNFLKWKDISNRRTPGVFHQYRYFLGRVTKQRLREARVQAMDYLILLLAGACLGSLAKDSDENFGAVGYTYTVIAVSLLCKISALRTFSLDKLEHWRESASGMSSLAYFLAKDTVDHFNTLIKPVVYLSMFYFFTNPRSSFADNYIVLLCLVYCVTGMAYAFTVFFAPGAAQLWSVLLPVVFTLIATKPQEGNTLKIISKMGYPRWALEAFVISNAERYYGVWLITRCGALQKSDYDLHNWNLCICVLLLFGVVSRVIAFVFMVIFQRK